MLVSRKPKIVYLPAKNFPFLKLKHDSIQIQTAYKSLPGLHIEYGYENAALWWGFHFYYNRSCDRVKGRAIPMCVFCYALASGKESYHWASISFSVLEKLFIQERLQLPLKNRASSSCQTVSQSNL